MNDKQKTAEATLTVNGSLVHTDATSHSNLLGFLRTELRLTGTKTGCESGNCGACTVLVDGTAMQSCQLSVAAADKSKVETIENIVQTPLGNQIATALMRHDAAQCGYCLPGIVVSAYAEILTATRPDPVNALQRNLCRCGTHSRILTALKEVMATQDSSQ